jgi:hypothetical protein
LFGRRGRSRLPAGVRLQKDGAAEAAPSDHVLTSA